jgi:hypothetical protein
LGIPIWYYISSFSSSFLIRVLSLSE